MEQPTTVVAGTNVKWERMVSCRDFTGIKSESQTGAMMLTKPIRQMIANGKATRAASRIVG